MSTDAEFAPRGEMNGDDTVADFASPKVWAMNLIRYVGDRVSESGQPIPNLSGMADLIGAPSDELCLQLVEELSEDGLIRIADRLKAISGKTILVGLTLSLRGWERYEAEKRGAFDGDYGFLAMQFGALELEKFVKDVLKPAVEADLGYRLVDMRDVGRAGVIDNIMRVQIRDAKFVVVDLTHDNQGAYWEAGYAEGLGKPVIYICERKKFEEEKTHFDTNHCTTIPWSSDDEKTFRQEFTATLRRTLEPPE